jgi:putative membrane protein
LESASSSAARPSDIQIQTASGSSDAEAVIEGVLEYESLRDFLYSKMRGSKQPHEAAAVAPAPAGSSASPAARSGSDSDASSAELVLLERIAEEMAAARVAAERLASKRGAL